MTDLKIHNGDNFGFLEANSVDFVLTDPPFNISKKTNFHTYEKNTIHSYQFDKDEEEAWDTYTHEEFLTKLDEWAGEWHRVLRKGGNFAIFCADAYISHLMEALKNNNLSPRRLIVWRKNNAVPINRAYMPMSANEYIIVGVKEGKTAGRGVTFNADIPIVNQTLDDKIIEATIVADKVSSIVYTQVKTGILDNTNQDVTDSSHIETINNLVTAAIKKAEPIVSTKVAAMYKENKDGSGKYLQACVPNYIQNPLKVGNRLHPTEKPVSILQYLVSLYSRRGDTVLDGFGGSGSTGEAALSLGRDAILIERAKDFYTKLKKRLVPQSETFTEII